ncbi:MAG: AarF/UbiB family protein [Pseudomonadota bacterium]
MADRYDAARPDAERNRFAGRLQRYAKVGANVGGVATRVAASRAFGRGDDASNAAELARALGGLKGPLMKVAQLLATIPDAVPPEYAAEMMKLQADAPPMGWAFVKRRMAAELGPGWKSRFESFEHHPTSAASLGQVHKAVAPDGSPLACKLQYPDMASAVDADIRQLRGLFGLYKRMDRAVDATEIVDEIADRVREELDYEREAKHAKLYAAIFPDGTDGVRIPRIRDELSTGRLLTMDWLDGGRLLDYREAPAETRNTIATAMFKAWWWPFARHGVIHGDPHLGNYTVWEEEGAPRGINLLDYGCIRIFRPSFVTGVIDLYHGLRTDDRARTVEAYRSWGFQGLTDELVDVLNVWARFIYGPLLDDRTRSVADGINPGEYGRREAFRVHQELKEKGPVRIPREFVFMDRAAIGLGSAFLHLGAEMNFYDLFNEAIADYSEEALRERQSAALDAAGLERPA